MSKGKGRELEEDGAQREQESKAECSYRYDYACIASTSTSASTLSTPTTPPPSTSNQLQIQAQKRQQRRQAGVGNVNEGYPACNNVGNNIASCYPDEDAVLLQNQWSKFIWNPNYVTFLQRGYVDIYLYSAGSEETLANWRNISNSRGSVGILPNDDWLPTQTTWTEGSSITHSYYFVVATQGASNPNGLTHQATFQVVQTAAPTSLSSILAASSSAGAAAASLASASSSLNSVLSSLANEGFLTYTDSTGGIITGTPGSPRRTGNPSSLQGGDGEGSSFPKWAIAVIVVLGVLALIAALVAAWVILRALRRKNNEQYARAMTTDGESLSATPMMAEVHSNDRPGSGAFSSEAGHTSLGSAGAIAGALSNARHSPVASSNISASQAGGLAGLAALAGRRSSSPRNNNEEDYYIKRSRGDPSSPLAEKPSVRSLASAIAPSDAAIISDAFRNMLRKPDFPPTAERERENSGSSGENGDSASNGTNTKAQPSPSSIGTTTPAGFAVPVAPGQERREYSSDEEEEFRNRSSDEENVTKEADEMIKTELASEGTSVRSIAERKRPDIRHD